jgi:DNA-binding CsgD family transcriptional regulator
MKFNTIYSLFNYKKLNYFYLAFIVLFISCRKNDSYDHSNGNEKLQAMEEVMLEYPERLDSLISKIDTIHLTRSDSGRYLLIKGFHHSWQGHYARSIHEISASESIFSDLGDDYHLNINNLVKAFTFEYINLDNDAAGLYLSCNEYFKNKKLEGLKIYSTLGLIRLSNVINLDKAALIDDARANIFKLKSPIFEGLLYATLGIIEKSDSLKINYYELAKKNFILAKSWHRTYSTEINQLFPKIRLDHSVQMEQYYWQLIDKYKFYTPIEFLRMRYRYAQGYLYSKQGKSKDAILTFKNILKELDSKKIPEIELDCVKFLAVLNMRLGNYKEASEYQYQQTELEKENKEILQQNQILALSSHYRFTELEQDKVALKLKYKNTFFLLCIISLVFTFILFLTMHTLKQSRLKREILRLKNIEIEEQFGNLLKSLENQRNKNQSLIEQVETTRSQYKDSQSITRLLLEIEQQQIKSWHELEEKFMELRHVWFNNIRKELPELTPTELRYCICLYLDLSNTSIANLCNVSVEAIKSAKKRLRNKFSLNEASEISDFLKKFE